MREYGQEYADSTLRHPSMGRCKHNNFVCQQCVKEHELGEYLDKAGYPSLTKLLKEKHEDTRG